MSGDNWLRRLPALVAECVAAWDLELDGAARYGVCALVVPVRTPDGADAMLKLTWPHLEAATEHLALRAWNGQGAVRLLAADPGRWAMLLERLHAGHDLIAEPVDAACATIGDLLRRLDRPALPQVERLSSQSAQLRDELGVMPDAIPRRYVHEAIGLLGELGTAPGVDDRLVHTDLHYANVLAADRAPWLAIDPKPLAAQPEYAITPLLWNRWGEAVESGNVRQALRRRVDIACDAGGLDADLARAWSVVREVQNAMWAAQDGDPDMDDTLTQAVTIIKAMHE